MEFAPEALHVRRAAIDDTDSVVRILIASKEASFADTIDDHDRDVWSRPEYRNRGIARALRARCLLLAKQTGHHTVHSASGNPALIHLNTTTGFQETYSEIRLVLRLAR